MTKFTQPVLHPIHAWHAGQMSPPIQLWHRSYAMGRCSRDIGPLLPKPSLSELDRSLPTSECTGYRLRIIPYSSCPEPPFSDLPPWSVIGYLIERNRDHRWDHEREDSIMFHIYTSARSLQASEVQLRRYSSLSLCH